jgi:hypothetical protein
VSPVEQLACWLARWLLLTDLCVDDVPDMPPLPPFKPCPHSLVSTNRQNTAVWSTMTIRGSWDRRTTSHPVSTIPSSSSSSIYHYQQPNSPRQHPAVQNFKTSRRDSPPERCLHPTNLFQSAARMGNSSRSSHATHCTPNPCCPHHPCLLLSTPVYCAMKASRHRAAAAAAVAVAAVCTTARVGIHRATIHDNTGMVSTSKMLCCQP